MEREQFGDLPLAALKQIDAICNRFEVSCMRGHNVRAEDFLGEVKGPVCDKLTEELLHLEVVYRRRRGKYRSGEEYAQRFPDFSAVIAVLFDASLAETAFEQQSDEIAATGPANIEDRDVESDRNIGRTIGNLQIVSRLGSGGMGAVYRARHRLIDCERAVKLLRPGLAGHPEAIKRFLLESQTAIASLDHPNVVKAFDVGLEGDQIYLVMELVDGEDLARLVAGTGPLSPIRAVTLIVQAASGLAFAHNAGFIHRDIKPHNLMLARNGSVKILDLGLVRLLEEPSSAHEVTWKTQGPPSTAAISLIASRLTDGGSILGTLQYMAPEQARAASTADARSDIYSLGCTLYYLLTGQHAFSGETADEILRKHADGQFQKPRDCRPDLPPSLESIVLKMLSLRPTDRHASARDVARVLKAWATQEALDDPTSITEPVHVETADELRDVLIRLRILSRTMRCNQ